MLATFLTILYLVTSYCLGLIAAYHFYNELCPHVDNSDITSSCHRLGCWTRSEVIGFITLLWPFILITIPIGAIFYVLFNLFLVWIPNFIFKRLK
jgi:hypothetical protein